MPSNKRRRGRGVRGIKGRPTRQEQLRRLKAMPGVYVAKGGKPKGARRPIKIKPGQRTLAEIVLDDRR